jgi:hypothetical protein
LKCFVVIGANASLLRVEMAQGSAAKLVMIATTLMSAGRPLRRTERSNVWSGQLIFFSSAIQPAADETDERNTVRRRA